MIDCMSVVCHINIRKTLSNRLPFRVGVETTGAEVAASAFSVRVIHLTRFH